MDTTSRFSPAIAIGDIEKKSIQSNDINLLIFDLYGSRKIMSPCFHSSVSRLESIGAISFFLQNIKARLYSLSFHPVKVVENILSTLQTELDFILTSY